MRWITVMVATTLTAIVTSCSAPLDPVGDGRPPIHAAPSTTSDSKPSEGALNGAVPAVEGPAIVLYVELAPQDYNGTFYMHAVDAIVREMVREHGSDKTWLVLWPNGTQGPVKVFGGAALTLELRFLSDDLADRLGGVGYLQFEHGLKRALELGNAGDELVLISAGVGLADMQEADRAMIKRVAASRTVNAISFGDRVDPPIDFAPLVSGRAVAITQGAVTPVGRDKTTKPATRGD